MKHALMFIFVSPLMQSGRASPKPQDSASVSQNHVRVHALAVI